MIADHDPRWDLVGGCPTPGIPDHVGYIVGDYRTRSTLAQDRLDDINRLAMAVVESGWQGESMTAFGHAFEELLPQLDTQLTAYRAAQHALEGWHAALTGLKAQAEAWLGRAEAAHAQREAAMAALEAALQADDSLGAQAARGAEAAAQEALVAAHREIAVLAHEHGDQAQAAAREIADHGTGWVLVGPRHRHAVLRAFEITAGISPLVTDVEDLIDAVPSQWAAIPSLLARSDVLSGSLDAALLLLGGVQDGLTSADLATVAGGEGVWADLVAPLADGAAVPPQATVWIIDPVTGEVVQDTSGMHGVDVPTVVIPTLDGRDQALLDIVEALPLVPTDFGVQLADLPDIDLPSITIPPPLHYFSWFTAIADSVEVDQSWVEVAGWDGEVVAPVVDAQADTYQSEGGTPVVVPADPVAVRG